MNCRKLRPELQAYLDDQVDPQEKAAIDDHLENCPECRKRLEALNETADLLSSLPRLAAPAGITTMVMTRVRAEARTQRRGRWRAVWGAPRELPWLRSSEWGRYVAAGAAIVIVGVSAYVVSRPDGGELAASAIRVAAEKVMEFLVWLVTRLGVI